MRTSAKNLANVMSIGGDWEKLKRLENTYAELDLQRSKALSTINKYEEKLKKALSEYENKTDATEKSTKSIEDETKAIEDLSKTMSDLSAKATTVANAEKEYADSGKITASTLQTIIDKYPKLENEVYNYILGLTDAQTLIKSMKNTYNDDAATFLTAQVNKNINNKDFYKNVMLANTEWVNDCKNKYNIDLTNYATWAQARNNITTQLIKQISVLPGIGQLFGKAILSATSVRLSP